MDRPGESDGEAVPRSEGRSYEGRGGVWRGGAGAAANPGPAVEQVVEGVKG